MKKKVCCICGEGSKDGHNILYDCLHCNKVFCSEDILDHMTNQNVIAEIEV